MAAINIFPTLVMHKITVFWGNDWSKVIYIHRAQLSFHLPHNRFIPLTLDDVPLIYTAGSKDMATLELGK